MGFKIKNGILISYQEEAGIYNVIVPDGITEIDDYAFSGCESLTSITLPNSITAIGDNAFWGCESLTSITLPDSLTAIGDCAFLGCSGLTSINLPDSITAIDDYAFSGCKSLTSITLPDSITTIGDCVFEGCSGLTSINLPDSLTAIGKWAFSGCTGLTSITLPDSLTAIGDCAFLGCTGLTSINLPDSITTIGERAFAGCENLTSITLPNSLTAILVAAFSGCTGLTSITLPSSLTAIGKRAFSGCTGLTSITLPNSLTAIGDSAFMGCIALTSIILPDCLTAIPVGAFSGCTGLTSITLPSSLTAIGDSAFNGCIALTSIILPDSLTAIGDSAFHECNNLRKILLPENNLKLEPGNQSLLKKADNLLPILLDARLDLHVSDVNWLITRQWKPEKSLDIITQIYCAAKHKETRAVIESVMNNHLPETIEVMIGMVEHYRNQPSKLVEMAAYVLENALESVRDKIIDFYKALQAVNAKSACHILESIVNSNSGVGGLSGHPIEVICQNQFSENEVSLKLKKYGISPNAFGGVRYQGSETLAPAFVVQCSILPYLQESKQKKGCEKDSKLYSYYTIDSADEIAAALEREDLQRSLNRIFLIADLDKYPYIMIPYCRYGSGKQMNELALFEKKWLQQRRGGKKKNNIMRSAMLLNDSREAVLLIDNWGLLEIYAAMRNTNAEMLRYTVLAEFDLDENGSKRYDLGNAVLTASLTPQLTVSLFNETTGKEAKSLPKRGADPERYALASKDFTTFKTNIKKIYKRLIELLKVEFILPKKLSAANWKKIYIDNYVLKRLASLLVWRWQDNENIVYFMPTIDGTFLNCSNNQIMIGDEGEITLAHPIELDTEELDCWRELLVRNEIVQPFVQMLEPKYVLDPDVVVKQYLGIDVPMFLVRGLAKEGILEGWVENFETEFMGHAIQFYVKYVDGIALAKRFIYHDQTVNITQVHFYGPPRAKNHEIFVMDKMFLESRIYNGDIVAIQDFSRAITRGTIEHLIDVSTKVEKAEVTAWLMRYKEANFPDMSAELKL
jgi:hypothetical protein